MTQIMEIVERIKQQQQIQQQMEQATEKTTMKNTEDYWKKQREGQKNTLKKDDKECSKCNGREWILVGDNEFAECECRQKKIRFAKAQKMLKESGLSEKFASKRLENFDCTWDKEVTNAFLTAISYVDEFDIEGDNISIMFCGQMGSGKTHLAIATANSLIEDLIGVMYMPYRSAMTKLKQNIMTDEYQKEIDMYKNAEVLLIDDLFKGKVTESDINIIFEIIDYRYFNGKPVIITTEKLPRQLIEIDEAIGSRLIEMANENIVKLEGKGLNYRLKNI